MAKEQKSKKNQSKDVKPADKPEKVIVKAEKKVDESKEEAPTLKAEKFFNQQTRLTEFRFTKIEDANP